MEIQAQEHTGKNAKEINNLKSGRITTKTEKIKGTPLMARWEEGKGWSFGMGGYRISDWYETEKEMKEKIENKDWDTIAGLIGVVVDATLKLNNIIK